MPPLSLKTDQTLKNNLKYFPYSYHETHNELVCTYKRELKTVKEIAEFLLVFVSEHGLI